MSTPLSPTPRPLWEHCVDRLYDAVGREQKLADALGEFRPFFNARGVTFLTIRDVQNPMTQHTGSVGVDEQALLEYHSHFNAYDEWVLAAQRRSDFGEGVPWRGSELVSPQRLRQTYFWKAFISRYGIVDILTAIIEAPHATGPASFITFHRHQGQRPFVRRDAQTLARLVPHLRQVLRLHRRLMPSLALGSTLMQVVQRMDVPVLFLASDGRVVKCNAAATAALQASPGWVRVQDGRLSLALQRGWMGIEHSLSALCAGPEGSITADLVSADKRCASLKLMAVQGAFGDRIAEHPISAIATLNPGPRDPGLALRQLHGLTAAEARVALQVAQGRSARDIADHSGQSMPTVRTHIAHALGKLGLQRQAQLVKCVMAL